MGCLCIFVSIGIVFAKPLNHSAPATVMTRETRAFGMCVDKDTHLIEPAPGSCHAQYLDCGWRIGQLVQPLPYTPMQCMAQGFAKTQCVRFERNWLRLASPYEVHHLWHDVIANDDNGCSERHLVGVNRLICSFASVMGKVKMLINERFRLLLSRFAIACVHVLCYLRAKK